MTGVIKGSAPKNLIVFTDVTPQTHALLIAQRRFKQSIARALAEPSTIMGSNRKDPQMKYPTGTVWLSQMSSRRAALVVGVILGVTFVVEFIRAIPGLAREVWSDAAWAARHTLDLAQAIRNGDLPEDYEQ